MKSAKTLILAAGKGTRMKSRKAKVLHRVGGATLVEHVVRAARQVTDDIVVVIGHQADTVRNLYPGWQFVEQTEQLGTGHAVMAARERLQGFDGDLLVLPGDVPLMQPSTLNALLEAHRQSGCLVTVLSADVEDPHGYGRIVRGAGERLQAIVEHRDASPEVLKIAEINSSIYVFDAPSLWTALGSLRNENAQKEYYLTDVVGILSSASKPVGVFKVTDASEVLGINTRKELSAMDRLFRHRKCEELMLAGVTIMDPGSTFIDIDVEIGVDSVIYPSVQIEGRTKIGEDVTIRSFCRITDCTIGNRTSLLDGCVLVDTAVGEDVSVGPYAHLRMHTSVEDKAKIGNFVEIKKSKVGQGTKAMHLSYLGDATIGQNVNIGAGTITCNYDGTHKHATTIEDDVFVGTDSQLIAPVRIGKGAYVAAGSSITDDVPADSLAIARGRQVIKEGWARARKRKS